MTMTECQKDRYFELTRDPYEDSFYDENEEYCEIYKERPQPATTEEYALMAVHNGSKTPSTSLEREWLVLKLRYIALDARDNIDYGGLQGHKAKEDGFATAEQLHLFHCGHTESLNSSVDFLVMGDWMDFRIYRVAWNRIDKLALDPLYVECFSDSDIQNAENRLTGDIYKSVTNVYEADRSSDDRFFDHRYFPSSTSLPKSEPSILDSKDQVVEDGGYPPLNGGAKLSDTDIPF